MNGGRPSTASTCSEISTTIKTEYQARFGSLPTVTARAPGRVNLIGEHTDYNGGFVLPFAIESSVWVAGGVGRRRGEISVYSASMSEFAAFGVDVAEPAAAATWQNYVRGVVAGLRAGGVNIESASLYVASDIPPGGGLASSAALSVATALALLRLADAEMEPIDIARLARRAEHEFAGTPCGIMDPYASLLGKSGHALLMDCRAETHEYVPIELPDCCFLLINTGIAHALAGGAYGKRVEECRAAVERLKTINPSVSTLRDVSEELIGRGADALGPMLTRRARHVVTENDRVQRVVEALVDGDIEVLGRCFDASHGSLRDDYDVSLPEVEELMSIVTGTQGVVGARMTGGGFGGSIIAVVRLQAVDSLRSALDAFGAERSAGRDIRPSVMEVHPSDGAQCKRVGNA